ncbi:hypothetical protein B0H34DRAFT_178826 [Crassisporium funariophilum]|nr:hypothetical protein B0H34DRAFT_178826 [Crassisporium funariophilum]
MNQATLLPVYLPRCQPSTWLESALLGNLGHLLFHSWLCGGSKGCESAHSRSQSPPPSDLSVFRMQYFYVFRNTLISLCLVLGIAVLGLVAHWTDFTVTLDAGVLDFQIVGLITAVMTILSFPVLLLVPLIRKNAAISHVIVELPVLLVAWVLWMTTAILIIRWNSIIYPFGCDFTNVENVHWCTEFFAIERLSIAIWILRA